MQLNSQDMNVSIEQVQAYLFGLQDRICQMLEKSDERATFNEDKWEYGQGGGGRTRTLEGGQYLEKAGVNFSHILGLSLPPAATAKRPELMGCSFQALGVSVVVHPLNPYAPTSHANVRFLIAQKPGSPAIWWFGGGFDMTPYYGFEEDCKHWHQMAKAACVPFGAEIYPTFKKDCDDYFYLKHRHEPRGIGGLFFDDMNQGGFDRSFALMQSVGDHYIKAYEPILNRRKKTDYSEQEREFQCYRRGRYAEFNLLYDRGTLFGLQSGGRTESILMSLPPEVKWKYNWQALPGSPEAKLLSEFLVIKEWV